MDRADILIVDDDRSWTESVTRVLREAGFNVRSAHDGEQAIDLLEAGQPAMLILDVHLPGINGIEVLRQFRERDSQTPVLMVSAEDQASTQDRAMTAGACGFLRKPISTSLLLRAVRRYLGANPEPVGGP